METLSIGSSMVKESKNFLKETLIRVNTKTEDLMDLVLTNGEITMQYMKARLKTDFGMGKENGHKMKRSIWETILKG